jgi:hypothetical protein
MRIASVFSALLLFGCAAAHHRADMWADQQSVQTVKKTSDSKYSSEAWAAWQKCCRVQKGMTYSQVYAILPSTGRMKIHDSHELESWFIVFENVGKDHVLMTVEYGADGRVVNIDRNIEHGIKIAIPHVEKVR